MATQRTAAINLLGADWPVAGAFPPLTLEELLAVVEPPEVSRLA